MQKPIWSRLDGRESWRTEECAEGGSAWYFSIHISTVAFLVYFSLHPVETFQLPEIRVIKLFPEVRLQMFGACFLHVGVYVAYVHIETHTRKRVIHRGIVWGGGGNWIVCQKKPWFLITVLPGSPSETWGKTTCQDSVSSTMWRRNPDDMHDVCSKFYTFLSKYLLT